MQLMVVCVHLTHVCVKMELIYKNKYTRFYYGDSLKFTSDILFDTCHITPISEKNLKDHNYDFSYEYYTQKWIKIFGSLLVPNGTFLVACLPPERDYILKNLEANGFPLIKDFVYDCTEVNKLVESKIKAQYSINHYLLCGNNHFCFLKESNEFNCPKSLISYIVSVTTKKGDKLLHPFMSTGKPAIIANEQELFSYNITDNLQWCNIVMSRIEDKSYNKFWNRGLE